MSTALFTHHHYGWRKHDLPNSHTDHLHAALMSTHTFLSDYSGQYRMEIERTPACSFDGRVTVFWDSDTPKMFVGGRSLRRGDHWFSAFEFNVSDAAGCRFCGATGVDHYVGPFFHCWACDGTKKQVRISVPRGFKHRPTKHSSPATQTAYEAYLAASEAA